MSWPTGCRCRPVIHNFLCLFVCVCVSATPAGLPTRHGSIRDQRPPFPLLSCPLQAQRVLNLKSKAQRALSQHAPFAASVSSPLPLGTWLKATRISVSGLFLQPSASSAFPLPLHLLAAQLRNFFGIVWVLPTSDSGVGGGFNCANCQRDKAASHAAVMELKGSLSLRGV